MRLRVPEYFFQDRVTSEEELLLHRIILFVGGLILLLAGIGYSLNTDQFIVPLWIPVSTFVLWFLTGMASFRIPFVKDYFSFYARLCYLIFHGCILVLAFLSPFTLHTALVLIVGFVLVGFTFTRLGPFAIFSILNLGVFAILVLQPGIPPWDARVFWSVAFLASILSGTYTLFTEQMLLRARGNEDSLKGLLNAFHNPVFLVDNEKKELVFFNQRGLQFLEMTGIRNPNLEGLESLFLKMGLNLTESIQRTFAETHPSLPEVFLDLPGEKSRVLEISFDWTKTTGETEVLITLEDITKKKAREFEIRDAKEKFKNLFDNSPEAILVAEADGTMLEANSVAVRLFQIENNDLSQLNILDFWHPSAREEFGRKMNRILKGETVVFESDIASESRKLIPAEIRGTRLQYGEKLVVLLHIANITERRSAQSRIRLFRKLLNHSYDAIYVIDPRTLRILDCNDRAWHDLGYQQGEMESLHLEDFVELADPDNSPGKLIGSLKLNENQFHTGMHIRKTGDRFPVETIISRVGVENKEYLVAVSRDITDRLMKEEALRTSEQRYRILVENMDEGIVLTDMEENVLFANDRIVEITGVQKADIMGMKSYDLLYEAHNKDLILEKNELRRQGISDQYEMHVKTGKGEEKWLLVTGAPYMNEKEEAEYTIAIFTDITARKKMEIKLREKNLELDSFVYRASHDLKGPLASIMGLTNIARSEIKDPVGLKYFDLIGQSAERLDMILMELIDVTRMNKAELEYSTVEAENLIWEIVNSLKHQHIGKKILYEVDVRVQDQLVTDRKLLRSILQNLIGNSISYQRKEEESPLVRIKLRQKKESFIFYVEDNGEGIPEELKDKIFTMFYRGNLRSTGTGLGLYIVKSSINKLGGKISLESTPGVGSVFSFELPLKVRPTLDPRLEIFM
jgi:PAS domain S-box-containing protein